MKNNYIPIRMCAVCRNRFEKSQLLRVAKNKNGEFTVDKSFKASGRGAYVCSAKECQEKLLKTKALNRAFKCEVPSTIYNEIKGEN